MKRHESQPRGQGIEEGLAARVHDPLWLLARQWQFGEFRHENAASPAWVDVASRVHRLDQWRPGSTSVWSPYDPAAVPLERLVEDVGTTEPSPRLRLEGGLRWRRLLSAAGVPEDLGPFVVRCPFPADPGMDPVDRAVRSGLPDGSPLAACLTRLADVTTRAEEIDALRGDGPPRSTPEALTELANEWLAWWRTAAPTTAAPQNSWDAHRFEHQFAVRSTTLPSVELRAGEYAGGQLDWSSVDAFTTGADEPGGETIEQRVVPASARFGGMPAARFWEMEDARFDPGSVDAAPIDLGRLMLVGYATVYGNDWFVVPMRVPVASLSRITRFEVHDVFGGTTTLDPVAADVDGWNLFGLTAAEQPLVAEQERPTSPWFFLAPSLPAALESEPTESVLFLRDEMANLAWAVEAVVTDDGGRRRDRFAAWAAREQPAVEPSAHAEYHVASDVPDHWFPLVPEQLTDHESIRLRLVPLSRLTNGAVAGTLPVGELLGDATNGGPGLWLHEEEVPRSGVRVTRSYQHARWHDGSRHLWQTRRKLTGHGEGSSGLEFDEVTEPRSVPRND